MAKAKWFWSGAITDSSVVIKAKISKPTQNVQIIFSPDISFVSDVHTTSTQDANEQNGNMTTFLLEGLTADTIYYYQVKIDDYISEEKGTFKTVKINEAYSFSVGCSSCARGSFVDEFHPTNGQVSNNKIFDIIRTQTNPSLNFFIHLGDLHYRDIKDGDIKKYRKAYKDVFAQERQRKLYQSLPIAYMWDDHDFTGNNSDGKNPGKYSASKIYRETVPHYPVIESLEEEESKKKKMGSFEAIVMTKERETIELEQKEYDLSREQQILKEKYI